jgi:hypothetical protein
MINQFSSRFNVYDQLGYLLVGSIALLVAYADFVLLRAEFPAFSLVNLLLWIIIAYFLGHLIQAMANLFLRDKKDGFSDREKEILDEARNYFGAREQSDGEVWNLCYILAVIKDGSGQVQVFNALYSLYRGWTLIFVMESLFIVGCVIYSFGFLKVVLLFLSLMITALFYARWNRFQRYLRTKVLQTFIVLKTIKST